MTSPTRRSRVFRRLAWCALPGLVLLSLVWLAVTAWLARADLTAMKADLVSVKTFARRGELPAARSAAAAAIKKAKDAHSLTTGPAWAVASGVPGIGAPLHTIRGISEAADALARGVLPPLIDASGTLDPAELREANGTFDLAKMSEANGQVVRSLASLTGVVRTVSHLSTHTWLGSVDRARVSLLTSLNNLDSLMRGAGQALSVAPEMLGEHGTKRYFVGLLNEAESRGIGGMPGSFAIVQCTNGSIKFVHFGSDNELDGITVPTELGSAFAQRYAREDPTGRYIWSDTSPNFPYAGQIWAAMWARHTGQHIDGALAMDPTALGYLLSATGSVTASDGTVVTAANVVALTESDLYARFPSEAQQPQRKQYLIGIAKVVDDKILHSTNTSALLRQMGRAAGERRVLVWSADSAVEAVLADTSVGGVIPDDNAAYVGPFITSETGNKLDYYLHRNYVVTRAVCGGSTTVVVSMSLTNTAPASGLSHYVWERNDHPDYPTQPGDQRVNANYLATDGATLVTATIDGRTVTARQGSERGHPSFQIDVELPRGSTRTVVLTLHEPALAGFPTILRQPLVTPLTMQVRTTSCHG